MTDCDIRALADHIRESVEANLTPGAVLLAGRGRDIRLREAYGFAQQFPSEEPMTPDTHFDLASVSKLVGTWATLLPLLQSGAVQLDEPIGEALARPVHKDVQKATVWNLLTHTAGFMPGRHTDGLGDTRAERIDALLALPPEYETGTKVQYSDISFIALGEIVARKTGMPLDQAARRVWDEMGMKDTCYNPPAGTYCAATEIKNGVVRRGSVHDEVATELGGVAGHAGVFSTALDLAKFCDAILPPDNNPIYEDTWLRKSYQNQTAHLGENRCLGWIAYHERPEGNIVGHTGFTGTSIWMDTVTREYVILLSNRVHPTRQSHDMGPIRAKGFEIVFGVPIG